MLFFYYYNCNSLPCNGFTSLDAFTEYMKKNVDLSARPLPEVHSVTQASD